MDEQTKKDLKKIARKTESRVTESILRWTYKKQGKPVPQNPDLQRRSRVITEEANQIISRRGKTVWKELKKAVFDKKTKGE
jgi:transcriptional regulator of met regulon